MTTDQVFSTVDIRNGDLRYRIEVLAIEHGRYMQRHIWLKGNAPYGVSHEGVDPWIPSLRCCFESVLRNGYEVSEVLPAVAR